MQLTFSVLIAPVDLRFVTRLRKSQTLCKKLFSLTFVLFFLFNVRKFKDFLGPIFTHKQILLFSFVLSSCHQIRRCSHQSDVQIYKWLLCSAIEVATHFLSIGCVQFCAEQTILSKNWW